MKRALTISACGNFVLGVLALFLAHRAFVRDDFTPRMISAADSKTDEKGPERDSGSQISRSVSNAFQWRQLESTNYRTYVANLRGIGCPEQTVRDIISADVHCLYLPKFQDLERKKASLPDASLRSQIVRKELETEFQNLRDEEASTLLAALDTNATPVTASRSLRQPISVPLVFQEVDPALKLDSRQREVISQIREKFKEDIGPNPDPNAPGYRQRWQTAQRNSDDMLAGMLGGQFFVEYQLHAGEKSSQSQ